MGYTLNGHLNVMARTKGIHQLVAGEGRRITGEALALLSPYQTCHVSLLKESRAGPMSI